MRVVLSKREREHLLRVDDAANETVIDYLEKLDAERLDPEEAACRLSMRNRRQYDAQLAAFQHAIAEDSSFEPAKANLARAEQLAALDRAGS